MKRVYKQAAARAAEGGWGVALDNRPMRTPTKHELIVPSAALAEAVAAEWDAQQDEIRTMPLTRLAATAIWFGSNAGNWSLPIVTFRIRFFTDFAVAKSIR